MHKIIKVFGAFALFLTFFSCANNYIALQDAEKGLFLERSTEVSAHTFFNRRMESELKSNINKNWFIVNEDSEYVYFGALEKRNGVSMVAPFYKTSKQKLDTLFPGYRSIEGKHVKAKVFQSFIKPILEEYLTSICPESQQVDYTTRDYDLTKKGIEATVKLKGRCYETKIFTAQINVILDPANLETIEQTIKIK